MDRTIESVFNGAPGQENYLHLERAILASAAAGIVATNPDGLIIHFNPEAERMLGYSAAELIGRHTPEIFHDRDEVARRALEISGQDGKNVEPGFEVFVRRAREQDSETREWTYISKEGRRFPVLLSVSVIRNASGSIEGYLGVARDITAIKQAQAAMRQSEEMLNRAQALAKIGSWRFNLRTNELTWSREHYRIFDLEELPGDQLYSAYRSRIHPDDLPELDRIIEKAIESGQGFIYNHRVIRKDGSVRYVVGAGEVDSDDSGKPEIVHGTVQDVTVQRAFEHALRDARDAAERANAAKSDFLSRMSHELRTPLNAIIGFTNLLLTADDEEPKTRDDFLAQVRTAGIHLLNLINEILDLSAVESGRIKYKLTEFNTANILPDIASQVAPIVAQKNLRLQLTDGGFAVYADFFRLKQILLNLVSNAIKYNGTEGVISLRTQLQNDDVVRISVSDTGPGIPDEYAKSIFVPFERLEVSGKTEGTGIGLAISRHLAEGMGGQLGFGNNSDRGTTFWIDIPRAKGDQHARIAAYGTDGTEIARSHFERRALKVLLIEDNLVNVALMEAFFKREAGVTHCTAIDGRSAIELLNAQKFDVALVDIHLPDMTGFEILEHIRAQPGLRHLRTIALSADAMLDQIERGRAAGFNQYLTKPVDFALLRAAMFNQVTGRS